MLRGGEKKRALWSFCGNSAIRTARKWALRSRFIWPACRREAGGLPGFEEPSLLEPLHKTKRLRSSAGKVGGRSEKETSSSEAHISSKARRYSCTISRCWPRARARSPLSREARPGNEPRALLRAPRTAAPAAGRRQEGKKPRARGRARRRRRGPAEDSSAAHHRAIPAPRPIGSPLGSD